MKNTILLLTIFATSTLFHTTTAEKSPRPWSDDSAFQLLGTYTVTTNNAEDGDLNILKPGQDVNIGTYEHTLLFYTSGRVIASLPADTIATVKVGKYHSKYYVSLTRYQDAFAVLDGSRVRSIPSLVLSAKRRGKRGTKLATWRQRRRERATWLRVNRTEEHRPSVPIVIPDEAFAADMYASEVGPETIPWPFLAEQDPDEYTRYINKARRIGTAEKLAKGRLFWNMLAQTLHSQDKKDLKDGEEMTPWPRIENQWSYYKQAAEKDSGDLELYLTGMPSNISAIEASRKKMVEAMTEYIEDNPEATLKQYLHSSESRLRSMDYETQLLQPNDDPDWTFAMQYTKCWKNACKTAWEHINGMEHQQLLQQLERGRALLDAGRDLFNAALSEDPDADGHTADGGRALFNAALLSEDHDWLRTAVPTGNRRT